jgi:hypothetical protein
VRPAVPQLGKYQSYPNHQAKPLLHAEARETLAHKPLEVAWESFSHDIKVTGAGNK